MRRFAVYTALQCKRALRLLPHVLAVLLLLALGACLAAAGLSARRAADAANRRATVGVVGDDSNPYIRTGVAALETFDAAREELKFVFMDEETAIADLRAGKLSAFLYLPDDFVESIYAGDVHPLRYVTLEGATGIDTLLSAELAAAVARLMVETDNAQYGAQRYAMDHLPGVNPYKIDDELVDQYFAMVLSRERLFSLKTIGLADTLSFGGYYLCGILTAFFLLSGIAASPLFSRRSEALGTLLRAQGFGALRQTLGDFLSFLLLMLPCALLIAAAALALLRRSGLNIPELQGVSTAAFLGAAALAALTIGAMQFFLYALIPSALGGVLLQFLCAAAMGYVCGCFYPYSFFPDAVQRLGAVLPAGLALRSLGSALRGRGADVWPLLACAAVFLLLSAALRRWRALRTGGAA